MMSDEEKSGHGGWTVPCYITKLKRERDEAREKQAESEEDYVELYDKCHELKGLCREAEPYVMRDTVEGQEIAKRLREEGGKEKHGL
jgi:hypothetical protein